MGYDEHRRDRWALKSPYGLVGILCFLTATSLLLWPVDGDQAQYYLGAANLAAGGDYYSSYWDIKQPGLYWFYVAAGSLGLGEIGARLLEMLLATAGGLLSYSSMRQLGARGLPPVVVSVLSVWLYVAGAFDMGVGQAEGLLGFLLAAQIRLLLAARNRTCPWAVAGVLTGVCIVLKILFVGFGTMIMLGVLWDQRKAPGSLRRIIAWGLGLAAPVAALVIPLFSIDAWQVFAYSTFHLPAELTSLPAMRPPYWLASNVRSLAVLVGVLGPLLLIGLRNRSRATCRIWDFHGISFGLFAAAVFGVVIGLMQYPTSYRYLMIAPLLSLLVVPGLEGVLQWAAHSAGRLTVAVIVAALTLAPSMRGFGQAWQTAHLVGFSLSPSSNDLFSEEMTDGAAREQALPVLSIAAESETTVYVYGDPRMYRWLGKKQPIAIIGWSPQMQTPTVWNEQIRELKCARPDLVFVSQATDELHEPSLDGFLSSDYRELGSASQGMWWRLRAEVLRENPKDCLATQGKW